MVEDKKIWTFTGHRNKGFEDDSEVVKTLLKVRMLQYIGMAGAIQKSYYVVGGAPGFDRIALESLIELDVPACHIIIAVPFRGFEKYANGPHDLEGRETYSFNLSMASLGVTYYECGADGSFGQKCNRRNQFMVDKANAGVFAYWTGKKSGGTWNTISMARKAGLPVYGVMEEVCYL